MINFLKRQWADAPLTACHVFSSFTFQSDLSAFFLLLMTMTKKILFELGATFLFISKHSNYIEGKYKIIYDF